MAYSFATGGSGWQMVPCMATFLAEVADCVKAGLLDVTNLGQIGDARHQAEPTSRHNPAKAPDGQWYVCAADFGGPDYAKLAEFHRTLYRTHDPRIYDHGFSQRGDGYGLSWPDGDWQWTGRDKGHCHFDPTMKHGSLGSDWWVDSLASTEPWGLANWLRTGGVTTAPPDTLEDDDMTPEQMTTFMDSYFAGPGRPGFDRVVQAAQKGAVQAIPGQLAVFFAGAGKEGFDRIVQAAQKAVQQAEAQNAADAAQATTDVAADQGGTFGKSSD